MLRIPHFINNRLTDGGEAVSLRRRPRSTPQKQIRSCGNKDLLEASHPMRSVSHRRKVQKAWRQHKPTFILSESRKQAKMGWIWRRQRTHVLAKTSLGAKQSEIKTKEIGGWHNSAWIAVSKVACRDLDPWGSIPARPQQVSGPALDAAGLLSGTLSTLLPARHQFTHGQAVQLSQPLVEESLGVFRVRIHLCLAGRVVRRILTVHVTWKTFIPDRRSCLQQGGCQRKRWAKSYHYSDTEINTRTIVM
jgi:hypothetical protein